ncbi:hypothetical protein [Niallia taxi]|uniref:hypothetical protein n=1 Tax=Niallia taxi TaxID=2499688 RepID=UPI0015F6D944|nr:hypothetical protein [Niallia taxi]
MDKRKKIALFYGNEEKEIIDAKETLEDVITELQSFRIEPERVRKDKVTFKKTEYWFVNIEQDDKVLFKNSFDVVYIVDRLKAEYQFQVSTIADKVDYIPYPFQALVNMVTDTKNAK